jgi:hypothetical protein
MQPKTKKEKTPMTTDDTLKIRELNDCFRRTLGGSGKRLMTAGVAALPFADQSAIVGKVMSFEDFTEANDPHGEHDFGSFTHEGQKLFWKIDYYDSACEFGSENPADPAQTTRVLTIMLAEEY